MVINLSVLICVICGELRVAGCKLRFYQYRYSSAPNSHLFSFSAFSGKARR